MAGHRSRRRSARRRDRGEATLDQSPHRVAPAERNHEGSVDSNDGGKASSDGEAAEVESGVGVADDRVASNAKKGVTGAVVVPFAADASPTVDDSVPTVSLPLMGLAATTKGDGFAVNAEDPAASARDATARDSVQFQNFQPPSSGLIHLQLPRGPLGVNIKKSPNGECVVSYSHDASPLRVGDVVVSLNGVKLVFVEGGNKAWAELFKDPSVSQRNLVVARCPKAGTANARVWWTDSEKARFDSGVIIWGWSNWAHIASYIPTRTKRQICKYANTLKETREDHFEKLKLERVAYRQRTQMQSSAEQNSDLTRSISIAPTNVKEDDDQLQNLIALSAQRSKNYVNGQNRASLLPSSDFVARPKMEHELLYQQQPGQMQLDPEEKWELKAVRTASEILQDCPTRCRCGAVACSMWASNLAPEDLQDSCLDCQENDYGGWPEKKSPEKESEVPIKYASVELRDAMTRVCTRLADPVLPDLPLNRPKRAPPAKLLLVPTSGLFDADVASILSQVKFGEDQTSVEERTVAAIYSTDLPAQQMAQQITAQVMRNTTRKATQLIQFTSSASKGKKRVIVIIYIRWSPGTKNDGSSQVTTILIAINYLHRVLGSTLSFEIYPIVFCGKGVDRRKSHESAGIHQLFVALRSDIPSDAHVWVFVNEYLRISSEAGQVNKFVDTLAALHKHALLKSVAEYDLDPKDFASLTQALFDRDSEISAVASHCCPGRLVPVAKNRQKKRDLVKKRARCIYSQIDQYRPTLTKAAALGNAQPEETLIADVWRSMTRSMEGVTAKLRQGALQNEAASFVSQYGNSEGSGERVAFYFRTSRDDGLCEDAKRNKVGGQPQDQASISLAFAEDVLGGDFAERLIIFHDDQVPRSNVCNKQFAKLLAMMIMKKLKIVIAPEPNRISSQLVQIELLDYVGRETGTEIKYSRCIGQDHLAVARLEEYRVVEKKASRGTHNEEEKSLRQSISDKDQRVISDDLKTIYNLGSARGTESLKELFSNN